MGTYIDITVPSSSGRDFFPAAEKEIARVEKLLDLKSGPVLRLNNGESVSDSELFYLLSEAMDAWVRTKGLFDITIEPVLEEWGFSPKSSSRKIPERKSLERALLKVGLDKIKISHDHIYLNGARINFGAMGKGYLLQRIEMLLKKHEINNALVDAGGDILALGTKNGRPWKIGIRDPFSDGVGAIVDLSGLSIATSGDYENTFLSNGKRYHHIINPKTGMPASRRQVTVINGNPLHADIYSTAFMLVQMNDIKSIAEKLHLGIMSIDENGQIWTNKIFRQFVK